MTQHTNTKEKYTSHRKPASRVTRLVGGHALRRGVRHTPPETLQEMNSSAAVQAMRRAKEAVPDKSAEIADSRQVFKKGMQRLVAADRYSERVLARLDEVGNIPVIDGHVNYPEPKDNDYDYMHDYRGTQGYTEDHYVAITDAEDEHVLLHELAHVALRLGRKGDLLDEAFTEETMQSVARAAKLHLNEDPLYMPHGRILGMVKEASGLSDYDLSDIAVGGDREKNYDNLSSRLLPPPHLNPVV